jgi:hypothetical protein
MIGGQGQIMQVNRVWAAQFQGLAAALNTAAKYTDRSVADMTSGIGRVRYYGVAAAQPPQGKRGIRRVATDGPHIGLFDAK